MSILVTGGAGFIGSHFIELLLSEGSREKIVCLDDFNDSYDPQLKRANAARFAADARVVMAEHSLVDLAAVRRIVAEHSVRQVVHLGGRAGVRASFLEPRRYQQDNVLGTLNVLAAATQAHVDRVVLVSSSTVYGAGAAAPFVEDAPLGRPLSPYGVTKRAAERLAHEFGEAHGLGVVRLRPFSVYGPRMRPDLAMRAFAEAILDRRPLTLFGDGSFRRDFTHVSDICRGLLTALSAPGAVGQAINLGHQDPASIGELIAMLERALGIQVLIDRREAFAGDMPLTCADLTKAQRLLNYQPQVALADGVREFVHWLKATRGAS